jgi:hypothetical protein
MHRPGSPNAGLTSELIDKSFAAVDMFNQIVAPEFQIGWALKLSPLAKITHRIRAFLAAIATIAL